MPANLSCDKGQLNNRNLFNGYSDVVFLINDEILKIIHLLLNEHYEKPFIFQPCDKYFILQVLAYYWQSSCMHNHPFTIMPYMQALAERVPHHPREDMGFRSDPL
jgi:hypothetical protein